MTMMSEEQLLAVTVGGRRPHDAPIVLSEYDSVWPAQFERLAAGIRSALGERVLQLEHVGSTSVPGLAAKPVIDLLLAVPDSADETRYVPPLERLGWALRIREQHWFEHRLLTFSKIEANLHVFSAGCAEIERMLRFRDHLRRDEGDRRLYEETKRRLAARTWKHVQDYADAKSDVVREIMARAGG
ncbi:MAG TPA: GrpB family protein [Pseudomonadales bacterium]